MQLCENARSREAAISYRLSGDDPVPSSRVQAIYDAGATTALHVGYALDDFGIERPLVSAVISNSGGFHVPAADAIEEDYGVINDPPYFYSEGPIFMTHATGDSVVDFQRAQDIADRADAVGHPCELFTVDAVSHGLPDRLFGTHYSPGVDVFHAGTCAPPLPGRRAPD